MKQLVVLFLIISVMALSASTLVAAEEFLVADISNCQNLTLGVYSYTEILEGEYLIRGCTELSPNFWLCDCDEANSFEIWMETSGKTLFDYSFRVDKIEAYPSGNNTPILSLFTADCGEWSECIDSLMHRVCEWEDGTISTIAMSCFSDGVTNETNTMCESDWICEAWGSCIDGIMTRDCIDLNSCLFPLSRPITSQACDNETSTVCEPDWVCSEWSNCTNGTIDRNCTDMNSCFFPYSRPILSQPCMVTCIEEWSCGEWTECINGFQTRSCNDANNCGTIIEQPLVSRTCAVEVCVEEWMCTEWSKCKPGNIKTRTCNDENSCGTTIDKPSEEMSCIYSDDDDNDGNGGGNGGGSGDNGGSSSTTDYNEGSESNRWICDDWSPCIDGRTSAFCYRGSRDSGFNYTKSKDCVEELPEEEGVGEEEPSIVVVGGEDKGNETLEPVSGTIGPTGFFGLGLPKQPWLWALLIILAIALIAFLVYKKGKGMILFAGKKKKKKGK